MTVRLAIGCLALCGCALIDALGRSSGDDTPGNDGSIPNGCDDPMNFNGCRISDCDGRLTLNGPESAAKLDRVADTADVVASTTKQGTLSIQQVSAIGTPAMARQLSLGNLNAEDAPIAAFANGLVGYASIAADNSISVALSDAAGTGGTGAAITSARAFGKIILIKSPIDKRATVVWADQQSMTLRQATVVFNLGAPATISNEQQLATLASLPTAATSFDLEGVLVGGGTKAFVVWTEDDAGNGFFVGFDPATGTVLHPKAAVTSGPSAIPRLRIAQTPNAGGALVTFVSSNNDLTALRIDGGGTLTVTKIVAAVTPFDEAAMLSIGDAVIELVHGPGNIVRLYPMSFDGSATRGVETLPLIPEGNSCGPVAAVSATSQNPALITYGRCDDNKREVDRLFCPNN